MSERDIAEGGDMILMVNGRQIRVTDGKVSYEDARWLAGEVKRLPEQLSGEVDGLTEMVRFNQESGQYDDTFNPLIKDDN